jgi:hypothetical protein
MRLVYKANQHPVRLGDNVAMPDGSNGTICYFSVPHKPDSEGKVTLLAEGAKEPHGTEVYVSVIGAEWIEREDRTPTTLEPRVGAALKRDPALLVFGLDGVRELCAQPYNVDGHVCPVTGRLAMTVADAYARADSPDRTFWLYNIDDKAIGCDPWREIDGVDAAVETGIDGRPREYTFDYADGSTVAGVPPECVIYMQRTQAEREPPLWVVDFHASGGDSGSIVVRGVQGADSKEAEANARAVLAVPASWHCTGTDRDRDRA